MKKTIFSAPVLSVTDASGKLNLFSLALPIWIEQISIQVLNSVSTMLISHVSTDATAATGVVNPLMTALSSILSVVSLGVSVLLSYALGKGDREEGQRLSGSAIAASLAVSLLLSGIMLALSRPVIGLFELDANVSPLALIFLRVRLPFLVPLGLRLVLTAMLRCHGRTSFTAICGISVTGVSVIGKLLTVTAKDLTIEQTVLGLGLASGAAQLTGFVLAVIFALRFLERPGKPDIHHAIRMIKIGFPSNCGVMFYNISSVVTTGIVAMLGTDAINAKVFVSSIAVYVPLFSQALSNSASVMFGRIFGKGDIPLAKRFARQNILLSVGINTVLSVIVFFFAGPLLGLFTDNAEIIRVGRTLLAADIAVEIFRAFNHALGNAALVSAKDIIFTSVLGIVSCWLVSVGGCRVLSIDLGLGIFGCWLAFAADELVRAVGHCLRWRSGKWMKTIKR